MVDWQPTAALANIKARAELNAQIRAFFAEREVLEVETPLMCQATATDPHLHSYGVPQAAGPDYYLQTSPEFAMKRLLAAGSGAIYQLGKSFRFAESGRRHNPEFTMLEWYRPGFDLAELMTEVAGLVQEVIGEDALAVERLSYREAFQRYLNVDPFQVSLDELKAHATRHISIELAYEPRDTWLDLLMSHVIEPQLGQQGMTFLYGYPPSQASLAQVTQDEQGTLVAARFELYIKGVELANGYHELIDAEEQRQRFEQDQRERGAAGEAVHPMPEHLLAALESGMPDCAGVALGVDRLLMLKVGAQHLDEVLTFPHERS